MQCPKCNYVLGDFDAECPRCRRAAILDPGTPPAPSSPPVSAPVAATVPVSVFSHVTCPHCKTNNSVPAGSAATAELICGNCKKTFVLTGGPAVPSAPAAPAAAIDPSLAKNVAWGCLLLFLVLIVLPITCLNLKGDEGDHSSMAYIIGRNAIKDKLKAPSTAKFPHYYESGVRVVKTTDEYHIFSYVDAQNSFGAMIRKRWTARVRDNKDRSKMELLEANLMDF